MHKRIVVEQKTMLRRKDTTKGPPLRILSLDGGGVRGYSMLIIIQELMHRTYVEIEGKAPRRDQIPKPCDHFDLIVGTGTGGLIALMLGRLRLDLETCKEVYVRMTRKVFETDKTIAGIPYRSTLFKASKLEEAIMECVQEHTIYEREGNDGDGGESPIPTSPFSSTPQRAPSDASVLSFSHRSPTSYNSRTISGLKWGNPNALLYDNRENRTKTAVTAIYKGTPKGCPPALLRSYDSRKEPSPEFNCTIWQAGRATSATGLAFKPITVGQSVFIDEGAGQYNPAPFALDEACQNEWPGRDVGVLVSVGTGKRPAGSDQNKHLWYEGFMGEYAEARRRLISKIEGCEETHQFMISEYLHRRGVNIENYVRFNVEIGVGEFRMNEWYRLTDISNGTRRYLDDDHIQEMNVRAAEKLARIHRAKMRYDRDGVIENREGTSASNAFPSQNVYAIPEAYPVAIELPGSDPSALSAAPKRSPPLRPPYGSSPHEALEVPNVNNKSSPRTSLDQPNVLSTSRIPSPRTSSDHQRVLSASRTPPSSPPRNRSSVGSDRFVTHSPTPLQYRIAAGADKISIVSVDDQPRSAMSPQLGRVEPPPLPPKTPLPDGEGSANVKPGMGKISVNGRASVSLPLPYPLDDGAPPPVNRGTKPEYRGI